MLPYSIMRPHYFVQPVQASRAAISMAHCVSVARTEARHRYTYCYNNPLKYTDPDGNEPITVAILIGVAIGGYAGGKIADAKGYDLTLQNLKDRNWAITYP